MKKESPSKAFTTFLNEDGIAITRVREDAEITIAEAKANTETIIRLTQGRTCPILVDTRMIKSISNEAREHFAMRGRVAHVNSIALLIQSPVSRIIGNFYISLNKPAVPTRLFTDESAALLWLRSQLNNRLYDYN
jgi:hypothetical protein